MESYFFIFITFLTCLTSFILLKLFFPEKVIQSVKPELKKQETYKPVNSVKDYPLTESAAESVLKAAQVLLPLSDQILELAIDMSKTNKEKEKFYKELIVSLKTCRNNLLAFCMDVGTGRKLLIKDLDRFNGISNNLKKLAETVNADINS